MRDLPPWRIPADLDARLADGSVWDDERYLPIRFSVEGGVLYDGRAVRCWQVEIDPGLRGAASDGHDLSAACLCHVAKHDPGLGERVHDDSESSTCVLWVEAEADAEMLVGLLWWFVFDAPHG